MEEIHPDLFSIVAGYLPEASINTLSKTTSFTMTNLMSRVIKNRLFWKEKTELLLEIYLNDRDIDWEEAYSEVKRLLIPKSLSELVPEIFVDANDDLIDCLISLLDDSNGILYQSILENNVDITSLLIEAGYDPTLDNNKPIILATMAGYTNMVNLLLNNPEVNPTINDNVIIIIASYYGYYDIVSLLLKDIRIDPSAGNNMSIINACIENHPKVVKLLLEDSRVDPSDQDNIAIINTTKEGFLEIVTLLLKDNRVNPSADDNSPIINASIGGHMRIVKLLLQYPNVDPSSSSNVAIIGASYEGHLDIVKLLLKYPNVDPAANNNKPIINACIRGHIKIVKYLLKFNKVDPSDDDNVAIVGASMNGHLDIIKILLRDPRVDPSVAENQALINASVGGYSEIVKLFLKDTRVNPADMDNQAIISASEYGNTEVVKMLLKDKRVNPSARDNEAFNKVLRSLMTQHIINDPRNSILIAITGIRSDGKMNEYIKVVELLLTDNRTNPFAVDSNVLVYILENFSSLNKMFMSKVEDSVKGLVVGYYYASSDNSQLSTRRMAKLTQILYSEPVSMTAVNIFYHKLIYNILTTKQTLIDRINTIISLVEQDEYLKKSINLATLSILNKKNYYKLLKKKDEKDLYGVIRGFLMLAYEPQYKYQEILDILKKEHYTDNCIKLCGKLLGAQLGFNKLVKQGIIITNNLSNLTKKMTTADLSILVNSIFL
jgi:ankyrin repeat protein